MSFLVDARDATRLSYDGHVLQSVFQPIFSFSHQRLIGHEALLRSTDRDGNSVPPQKMFDRCSSIEERRALDRACCLLHARGFARGLEASQWLFLNVDASAFDAASDIAQLAAAMRANVGQAGLLPSQIVIELLETALPDGPEFEHWTEELKRLGFILALDDFGAGRSNFDRVFRLRPHIVKLDRTVIERASVDRTVRRVTAQMISLLHECGAQVLIEGVESATEANIALDSNADFVQGYHFARPAPTLRRLREPSRAMTDAWANCDESAQIDAADEARRLAPYCAALKQAKRLLEAGLPMEDACDAFLALKHADVCYLLDENGAQVDRRVFHKTPKVGPYLGEQFAPLVDVRGARWSRRPYFRSALATPGELQVTRPYPTMHSALTSVTISVCFVMSGRMRVLCGDKLWHTNREPAVSTIPPRAATAGSVGPRLAPARVEHDPVSMGGRPPGRRLERSPSQ